jgi:hypothetical protein
VIHSHSNRAGHRLRKIDAVFDLNNLHVRLNALRSLASTSMCIEDRTGSSTTSFGGASRHKVPSPDHVKSYKGERSASDRFEVKIESLPRVELMGWATSIQRLHRIEEAVGDALRGVRLFAKPET